MALANQLGLTNKVVSERHFIASQSKYTAGEAAKLFSKKIGQKISAKALVNAYKVIMGCEPEWHHSGFYKSSGKSTMGRTFFFTEEQINDLAADWNKVAEREAEIMAEEKRKQETIVKGFYYKWDYDYSGRYGKKVNFKVLGVYEGAEASAPRNFTSCSDEIFEKAQALAGKKYYGWDEPKISDFI